MAERSREAASGDGRPVLRLAHSPDPDDAFMWWPLFEIDNRPARVESARFRYEPVMDDIESLNRRAETGEYEITAISCAHYPTVADRYAITACGASMGEAYGPKLISARALSVDELRDPKVTIAVPGTRTSAFATLSLLLGPGAFRYEAVPFDRIIEQVASGEYAAGVVIHEGQLTFEQAGLHLIADLGQWWGKRTGLPLPLGVNAVRRDIDAKFGSDSLAEIAGDLLRSVEYALQHREDSVAYALQFARGMGTDLADEFIRLYVNRWTLDFGERGRAAVGAFLETCANAGLVPPSGPIDFVSPGDAAGVAGRAGR